MSETITRWQLSENSTLIAVYAWLRLVVAGFLQVLFVFYSGADLGQESPQLFSQVVKIYLVLVLLAAFYLQHRRDAVNVVMIVACFIVDIVALIFLTHASGGIGSGLPNLLVVVVSIAAILLGPRLAIFIAALAALGILLEMAYRSLYLEFYSGGFLLAGLYGMAFFAASLLISNIASRLRITQQLAIVRAADVAKLQQLNQLVVERLRTGLIVLDWQGRILMVNRSAKDLIFNTQRMDVVPGGLAVLPNTIKQVFEIWREDHSHQPSPLRMQPSANELQISFTKLSDQAEGDVLVFVEDQTEISQRAQQMKLASLGRFTASIAHEIRNPLGAISHAAQLLSESEVLDEQDRQLSNIIQNHCLRMNRVIENVLQLSRRHQARQELFLASHWLEKFLGEFSQSQQSRPVIDTHTEADLMIRFDPDHLAQVMNNLVDNALRYGQQKNAERSAEIRIYQNSENGLPCIDVIDKGDGIADADLHKIFEPFFTTEAKGNGLGLYLCRQLCEANQAMIAWLKLPDGRSCFRIMLAHPDRRSWIANN